jgi:hypothetical protein
MDDTLYGIRTTRGEWTPNKRADFGPVFKRPTRPLVIVRWLFRFPGYYLPWEAVYLFIAWVAFRWLSPTVSEARRFQLGWVAEILGSQGQAPRRLRRAVSNSIHPRRNARMPNSVGVPSEGPVYARSGATPATAGPWLRTTATVGEASGSVVAAAAELAVGEPVVVGEAFVETKLLGATVVMLSVGFVGSLTGGGAVVGLLRGGSNCDNGTQTEPSRCSKASGRVKVMVLVPLTSSVAELEVLAASRCAPWTEAFDTEATMACSWFGRPGFTTNTSPGLAPLAVSTLTMLAPWLLVRN